MPPLIYVSVESISHLRLTNEAKGTSHYVCESRYPMFLVTMFDLLLGIQKFEGLVRQCWSNRIVESYGLD